MRTTRRFAELQVNPKPGHANMSATGIEAQVCRDITSRQALGVAKYGTTVADNPLTLEQWLFHAYEECLDQAVYLRRAIEELRK